jgi:hypothetical protein
LVAPGPKVRSRSPAPHRLEVRRSATVFEGQPDKLAEIVESAKTLGVELIIIDTPS